VARRELRDCRCRRADLNPSRIECRTWKRCALGPRSSWSPQPQGRAESAALRRPKKPRPAVARRIGPRRSGVEWQEHRRNRLQPGRANDERRQSLGASRSCCPRERSQNGRRSVLPSCPKGLGCVLKMHHFPTRSGSARASLALERLELCEAKVSCTVLRGALGG
jgi:hypothetical protein